MNMSILKILLLICWITGLTAVEPAMTLVTHYRLTNSSVCLHVRKTPPYRSVKWKFKNELLVVEKDLNDIYVNKMVFNPENLTLCIMNLTERDSGIYEASFTSKFKESFVRHQLIVQENVPRPIMDVMPEKRSNLSAASCRFTVNCSIQDDQLLSVCDGDGCRPSEKSFSNFNMTIVSNNTAVVCSSNNYVSTNNISESYATWCYIKSDPEPKKESQPHIQIELPVIIITLCAIIIFASAAFCLKHVSKKHHPQTAAAVLIQSGPLDTQPPTEPRTSTSSSSEADHSYENVDINQPRGSSSIPRGEQGSGDNQGVDTVYSIPTAPASRVKYESSKNGAGDMDGKTDPTPETAAEVQEQGCEQTETVYYQLEKITAPSRGDIKN